MEIPGVKAVLTLGDTIFVGGQQGLEVMTIEDPARPRKDAALDLPFIEALATDGTYLYVAQGVYGVKVIDPWAKRGPRLVSHCDDIYAVDLLIREGRAYVASGTDIKIVDLMIPPWLQSVGLQRKP
ncbi:MAG: hypothetical protein HC888_17070 [Candidatus Competibacteraceae bacterium]|nr:hypothetical protein [Candidatus Competibacteraceae bacterium]